MMGESHRSAARMGSEEAWKQQDPQIPKSVWYHTDAILSVPGCQT